MSAEPRAAPPVRRVPLTPAGSPQVGEPALREEAARMGTGHASPRAALSGRVAQDHVGPSGRAAGIPKRCVACLRSSPSRNAGSRHSRNLPNRVGRASAHQAPMPCALASIQQSDQWHRSPVLHSRHVGRAEGALPAPACVTLPAWSRTPGPSTRTRSRRRRARPGSGPARGVAEDVVGLLLELRLVRHDPVEAFALPEPALAAAKMVDLTARSPA